MPAAGRSYSLEDFARRLGVTVEQVERIDFRPAMEVCARLIQNDTRERFRRGEDPDGKQWKPLKRPRKGGSAAAPPKPKKPRKARKPRKRKSLLAKKVKAGVVSLIKKALGTTKLGRVLRKELKLPKGKKKPARKKKGRKRKPFVMGVDLPLWDTGRLVASVGAGSVDHVEEVDRRGLVYGTNVSYAPYHQYGTRTIPARPFLGIGDDLAKQLEDVLVKFAEDEIVKALGG